MVRNLKSLGWALAAVLAIGAMAVTSTASAAPKLTAVPEQYPVTMKAAQTVTNVLELEGTRATECSTVTFEGTVGGKSEAENSSISVHPTYANCTTTILGNKDPTTITTNECTVRLPFTETTTGGIAQEGWEVTGKNAFLDCEPSKPIEIHVFASTTKHEAKQPLCTYDLSWQTLPGDVDYKLVDKNAEGAATSGRIKLTITGVEAIKTSGTVTNCGGQIQFGSINGELNAEFFGFQSEMLRTRFED